MPTLRSRASRSILIGTAAALTVTACSPAPSTDEASPSSADLIPISVVSPGIIADGALLTGIDQGFFEEEGLDVSVSIVQQPPASLAAVQSGQVDIAYSPSIPLLNAIGQGIPLKLVAPAGGFPDGSASSDDPAQFDDSGLYVSPSSAVTSVAELADKTIAVPARKAQNEIVVSAALTEAGVDPNAVQWVVLDFASSVEALKSETIDAVVLFSPFTAQAEAIGARLIAHPSLEFTEEGASGYWVTSASTAESKRVAMEAFQRAMDRSHAYANANPEEAMQAGIDYTKSTLTVDELPLSYWPEKIRVVDLQRAVDKLVNIGFLESPTDIDALILESAG